MQLDLLSVDWIFIYYRKCCCWISHLIVEKRSGMDNIRRDGNGSDGNRRGWYSRGRRLR